MVNKKGWIRIVEASIAILIILAAILVIYGNVRTDVKNNADIKAMIKPLLLEIAQNSSLRDSILAFDTTTDIPSNNETLSQISTFIKGKISNLYLDYRPEICNLNSTCPLTIHLEKDMTIYADDHIITSNLTLFTPKKLKIFLWEKV